MDTNKNPRNVSAGKKGAEARWGPPRTIDLRDLPPEQRAFIAALIDVARKNNAAIDKKQDRDGD